MLCSMKPKESSIVLICLYIYFLIISYAERQRYCVEKWWRPPPANFLHTRWFNEKISKAESWLEITTLLIFLPSFLALALFPTLFPTSDVSEVCKLKSLQTLQTFFPTGWHRQYIVETFLGIKIKFQKLFIIQCFYLSWQMCWNSTERLCVKKMFL